MDLDKGGKSLHNSVNDFMGIDAQQKEDLVDDTDLIQIPQVNNLDIEPVNEHEIECIEPLQLNIVTFGETPEKMNTFENIDMINSYYSERMNHQKPKKTQKKKII